MTHRRNGKSAENRERFKFNVWSDTYRKFNNGKG